MSDPDPNAPATAPEEDLANVTAQRDQLARQLIEQSNQHQLDNAMRDAGAVDPETCETILRKRLDFSVELDAQTAHEAVKSLLHDKPFLRQSAPPATLPPMSAPAATCPQAADQAHLENIAQRAATSGNRRDISDYLRLRRKLK
jgi:hypothetical protein